MNRKRWGVGIFVFLLPVLVFFSWKVASSAAANLEIVEAKTALKIDENRKPVDVTSSFPPATEGVYCWFSWKGAKPGLQMMARWHYVSEDIHILDFPVTLTRVSDSGVISLKMPPGKSLPPGAYRLDMEVEDEIIKSLSFTVRSK